MKNLCFSLACVVALGCTTHPTEPDGLGIVDYQVSRTVDGLDIVGLDKANVEIGRVTLWTGTFTMEEDGRTVLGRKLTLTVGEHEVSHESEGLTLLKLPPPGGDGARLLHDFLDNALVASELAQRGVNFDLTALADVVAGDGEPPAEVPTYNNCSWASCQATSTRHCGANYGCPDAPNHELQAICCNGSGSSKPRSIRYCAGYSGGLSTPCGNTGTNGCAVCWLGSWSTSCNVGYNGEQTCYWGETEFETSSVYFNAN